jgi:hypothetical protein
MKEQRRRQDRFRVGAERSWGRANLQQLKEMDLCRLEHHNSIIVVTLTERVSDVGEGCTQVEGVRRPGPDCSY